MKKATVRNISVILIGTFLLSIIGCSTKSDLKGTETTPDTAVETSAETSYIDSLPDDAYYDGEEFNIGWSTPFELNECVYSLDEAAGEIVNESVYKRNLLTEQKLGIVITGQQMCDSWEKIMSTLQTQVTAGDCPYDALCASAVWMFRSSLNSLVYDMNNIPSIDFTHDWWDTEAIEMYSFNTDNIYFASGMINYVDDYAQSCLLFNKVLCDDYGLEYPYQLVRDGKWTFDALYEYISKFGIDVDGNNKYDENDIYGYFNNTGAINIMAAAAGENIIIIDSETSSASLNNSERLLDVIENVFDKMLALNNNAVCIAERKLGYEVGNKIFPNGNSLFAGNMMVGFVSEYRLTMEDDFGVLPNPKYNEEQENYSSLYNTVYGTAYAIPVTNDDTEQIGMILDVMGYYSTDTIYEAVIEKNIITKSTRDEESVDMLKIIFNTKFYELGGWGSTIYEKITPTVGSGKNNYSSLIAANNEVTASEFAEISNVYKFD